MRNRKKTMIWSALLSVSILSAGFLPPNPLPSSAASASPVASATPAASKTPVSTKTPAASKTPASSATPTTSKTTTASPSTTKAPSSTSLPSTSALPATTTSPSAVEEKNPLTGLIYKHPQNQEGKNAFIGIDVSYHQGTIDWQKVKKSGVQFVFLRLGYRGYSAGNIVIDKNFRTYAQGAAAAGLPIGVYFYTEAINENEAAMEATYCIEQLNGMDITLPVAYDFEPGTNNGRQAKAKLSKSKATALCDTFCSAIQTAGYTPMIYANRNDLLNKIDGAALGEKYLIWLAQYNTATTYPNKFDFWQYSSKGKVNGISGSVDCNFWYTDNTRPDAKNSIKISDAAASAIKNQKYSGKEKTPAVTLTYNGKTLEEGTDYMLSYSQNIEVGIAEITIQGINDFTGTKVVTFKIIPRNIKNFNAVATTTKKISLKWSQRSEATGYLLYRKTTENSTTYKKIKTLTSNAATSFSNLKLDANRTYFYRIRSYKDVNGIRYYGKYTTLEAATMPTAKTQTMKAKTVLYENPETWDSGNTAVITIPKNKTVTHLGKLYVTDDEFSYHVSYTKNGVTYEGYISSETVFK